VSKSASDWLNSGRQSDNKLDNMTNYGKTSSILKAHNLSPKKRFGQNFLVHKQTAEAIVKAGKITDRDIVLEVGVGLGALTHPLAGVARHVFGFEIDRGIVRLHEEQGDLPANVTLYQQDILTANFAEMHLKCGGDLIIMANLPYSISNPFIFKLIDNAHLVSKATVMLQKEVAERLMAEPRSKEYGIPTVLLGACASVKKLMVLRPSEFHPQPKIDSVVVSIDFSETPRAITENSEFDRHLFKQIVRIAFSQRRKTLLNTLSSGKLFMKYAASDKKLNKAYTQQAIEAADVAPSIRPECLDLTTFINITTAFKKLHEQLAK